MTKPGPATLEACGAAGANMESGAKEEAANDTNSRSETQEASSASEMTIKKAVATADNARISLGGAVEATATKVDKDNRGALSGANAAAVEDASATEQAKVRHFRTRSKTRHEGRTRTPKEAPQGSLITLASSAVSGARSFVDRPITMLRANTPHYYRRRQRWRSNH